MAEIKKQLRKPEHWQDFETLCSKLWGEIWRCPEIKKNGRSGQAQHGVDIYGVPKGEDGYYGIQCKGKDDYTHAALTADEVREEVEKARGFEPTLKKFYIATTSNKDAAIEKLVRELDLEHRALGLFEVHLFSWEDIVDRIDENRETHDWYLKSAGFKNCYAVELTFEDRSTTKVAHPLFLRRTTERVEKSAAQRNFLDYPPHLRTLLMINDPLFTPRIDPFRPIRDFSLCDFQIALKNSGTSVIENGDVEFKINGEFKSAGVYSKSSMWQSIRRDPPPSYNCWINQSSWNGNYKPDEETIVQGKQVVSDAMYIEAIAEDQDIIIEWEFRCRDYSTTGTLLLELRPQIEDKHEVIFVEDASEAGTTTEIVPVTDRL